MDRKAREIQSCPHISRFGIDDGDAGMILRGFGNKYLSKVEMGRFSAIPDKYPAVEIS